MIAKAARPRFKERRLDATTPRVGHASRLSLRETRKVRRPFSGETKDFKEEKCVRMATMKRPAKEKQESPILMTPGESKLQCKKTKPSLRNISSHQYQLLHRGNVKMRMKTLAHPIRSSAS